MKSSSVYSLLFIPFALAGVVLIIMMLKCNLTVSTGTLNGLIIYANFIQACTSCCLPTWRIKSFCFIPEFVHCLAELRSGSGGVLLSRHGCIHQNMVAVCLSYVYLDRGCTYDLFQQIYTPPCTIARVSGSNTVSVLATPFLLSYTKFLRTIISAISFTTLTNSNGKTSAVWLYLMATYQQ